MDIGSPSTITDNIKPFNQIARFNFAEIFASDEDLDENIDTEDPYETIPID